MDALILTYAPADEPFARHLAEFLEANLAIAVSCTESVVGPDLDLIDAAERALSAEAALILLSPHSVPKAWVRQTWEPVFIDKPKEFQTHLGFVLLDACTFPEVFRRQRFFDAAQDSLAAHREIKRWLLRPKQTPAPRARIAPEHEDVRRTIADKPGTIFDVAPDAAIQFAAACGQDFEAVHRFDLRDRTRAGIAGDIGSALGLPMSGSLLDNRATLTQWSLTHRVLFVLANVSPADREFVTFGGRTSAIFTTPVPAALPSAIRSEAASTAGEFRRTLRIETGWAAVNLLKAQERFTEVLELLDAMSRVAGAAADTSALRRIEREQFWLQGCDGQLTPDPTPAENGQLAFAFD